MRKLIITGMAVAMLAVPAAASASVNVDDSGAGFVGKGDVQTALGYANDAEFQPDAAKIKFTQQSEIRSTVAHGVKCAPLATDGRPDTTQAHVIDDINLGHGGYTTKTLTATPKGGNDKVTGWNLTGGTTETSKSTMNYLLTMTSCPDGESFVGYVDEDTALTSHITPGGLMVSNDSKTVALPNTPVELAPVA